MDTLLWITAIVAAVILGRWWGERQRRSRETFRLVARTRDLRREMKTADTALQSALQELEQLKATVGVVQHEALLVGASRAGGRWRLAAPVPRRSPTARAVADAARVDATRSPACVGFERACSPSTGT